MKENSKSGKNVIKMVTVKQKQRKCSQSRGKKSQEEVEVMGRRLEEVEVVGRLKDSKIKRLKD